ncbi:hypothetical protein CAPTEDRAFT_220514 [Capitella teleta]|uniref:Uncharacterized protein n=1 Tax=Capitella teleta TaxID=283909 RepID=R7TH22_CAPTE|nr:hypothetical protein CAPTEDRAFT_220514 [Capitella teleta]|eukprot:ELT93004.1 hypothetical protein CAPTEDRAFT_220514 [Capitella teleta]
MVVFEKMMARMSFDNEHGMCDSPVLRDVSGNAETSAWNRNSGCHHPRMHQPHWQHCDSADGSVYHHHGNRGHGHHHGFHGGHWRRFSRETDAAFFGGHGMKHCHAFGGEDMPNQSFHGRHWTQHCHAKKCCNVEEARTPDFAKKCAGFKSCGTENAKKEEKVED